MQMVEYVQFRATTLAGAAGTGPCMIIIIGARRKLP